MTNLEFYKEEIKKLISKKLIGCAEPTSLYDSVARVYREQNGIDSIYNIFDIVDWLCEEHQILDKEEKEYLSNVIKPFRKKVKSIIKCLVHEERWEYVTIFYEDIDNSIEPLELPCFEEHSMYKGMELGKEYTLEELGL